MIEERAPGEALVNEPNVALLQEHPRPGTEAVLVAADLALFGLWFGGLVLIGGLVAPIAFNVIQHSAAVSGGIGGQKALAGAVVGGSLRIYNVIAAACEVWLTVRIWRLGDDGLISKWARLALAFPAALTLTITAVQALILFPVIDHAQALGRMQLFDRLHYGYVLLADAQMALMLAFAGCYGWLLSRRMMV